MSPALVLFGVLAASPPMAPPRAQNQSGASQTETREPSARRPLPRLVVAAHGIVGPLERGEEACRLTDDGYNLCDETGDFLSVGGNLELRVKAYRALGFSLRTQVGGNAAAYSDDRVFRGMAIPALGVGLFGRRGFLRVEIAAIAPIGSPRYRSSGFLDEESRVTWRPVAATLGGGIRFPLRHRPIALELIGAMVIGPKISRETANPDFDRAQILVSFMAGFGVAFDVMKGR